MGKNVEIKKTVFDRKGFQGVIDNKFKFFKEPDPIVDNDTVQELFRLYDKLYALVQIEGEEQSHQYLVERSSELYRIDAQLESIQPLLDEVASLRTQLLEGNRRILELETKLASGGEINFADGEQMALLRTQLETANSAIATLEMANSLANRATEEASKASEEAAKKSLCGNCVAFDISPRMKECMPGKTSDKDGELGYCWMHHFKCHSARACHTWAKGGPIDKDKISQDWQERNE